MGLHRAQGSGLSSSPPIPVEPFDAFVRAHQGAVRAFLRRLTGEAALADDLAQDSFVRAHASRHRLRDPAAARSWLYRIAYRQFLDHRRTETRRRQLSETAPESPGASPPASGLRLDLDAAMAQLPPERRACLTLGLALGHSHREVADITGLPLGTVKSHIERGKRLLREALSPYKTDDRPTCEVCPK